MRDLARKAVPIAAVIALLMASGAARLRAQNLVTNGGFEAGNAGWSFSLNDCTGPIPDPGSLNAATGAIAYDTPHSGSQLMWFGAVGCTPSVFQSLNTALGQTYDLNFWLQVATGYNNVPNFFEVAINNATLFSGQISNNPWQEMSYSFTGTGSDVLQFSVNNAPGGTELDDVSVTSVTPEPASLVLLATGLLGMGGVLRRRRKMKA